MSVYEIEPKCNTTVQNGENIFVRVAYLFSADKQHVRVTYIPNK